MKRVSAMNKPMNRNAHRSIRMLKDAFVQLLAEKPYESISVSDVTRRADLNRGTFYAHFDNIDDLFRCVMEDITTKVSHLLDQTLDGDFLENPLPVLKQIGNYLDNDRKLYHKLVSSTSAEMFINSLTKMFRGRVRERLIEGKTEDEARFDVLVSEYLASGILGTYRAWLVGEYGATRIEEVNQDLCRVVIATGGAVRSQKVI
jgi:AcrR family transcriptional regulator